MVIKAIETHYRGHRFRSRLEARWAVFFETVGASWRYEHEGYDLDGLWYLPDFLLPDWGVYAEIKPGLPNSREFEKAIRLADKSERPVLVFAGQPYPKEFVVFPVVPASLGGESFGLYPFDTVLSCVNCDSGLYLASSVPMDSKYPCIVLGGHSCVFAGNQWAMSGDEPHPQPSLAIACAFAEARGARFEFGESGG